jgi:hypothetical protein
MAFYNFPPNPNPGDTYVVGTRTFVWSGYAWQIQTNISSTNPLTAGSITATTSTNSTSTNSGGLVVFGGAGIGKDLYVGGNVYVQGSLAVTTATIGNYLSSTGVSSITAGTDTTVSSSTGSVTIWNTSTLQSITNRGSTTTNAIKITNTTASTSTTTGALTVAGGVGVGGSITVNSSIKVGDVTYDSFTSDTVSSRTKTYLDSFAISEYGTVKYLIQISEKGYTPIKKQVTELIIFHDNNGIYTNIDISSYFNSSNLGILGDFDAEYVGGFIQLTFTPNYSPINLVIKLSRQAIDN